MLRQSSIFLAIGVLCLFAALPACKNSPGKSQPPDLPPDVAAAYEQLPDKLDYNIHVKPILADKCFACHGPDKNKQKAGLRLDLPASATAPLPESPGKVAIHPGDPQGSELFHRILSADAEYKMPTPASHLSLTAHDKAVLIKWIGEGATYKPHWAFVKPELSTPPAVQNKTWTIQNPIDNFILHRLEEEKLTPSPQAPKELLLRRLSLDLTGLPPTPKEIDEFVKDTSTHAYEKQVDRLLNSPHYGEKMAVDWLDLARFADSHGYSMDNIRDMSPYRDWVIRAFNTNMPYDQFIQWQLAGDLMPHPTRDMMIATAFNRNHPQNMEGGIVEEEYQTEYVIDRTNTFGNAFLGLSVGCAKCHDHKYDPITQKNYYELFSFFNNVKEAGQISLDNAMPSPTMLLPTKEQEKIGAYMQSLIAQQEQKIKQTATANGFEQWLQTAGGAGLTKDKTPQTGLLAHYTFDDTLLNNSAAVNNTTSKDTGILKREMGQTGDKPVLERSPNGKAIVLNGDTWVDLGLTGVFRASDPFSISIRVKIPKELKEGVIFHKCVAERTFNFRGYHLYLRNGRLELNMAHVAPANAITRLTKTDIPRDKWIQLTMTYDGSARAAGMRLYLDGSEMEMETTMDQLTKDILYGSNGLWLTNGRQPGLQIGGWWRGLGFKNGRVDDLLVYDRTLTPYEIRMITGTATSPTKDDLKTYYLSAVDTALRHQRKELRRLRAQLADSTENIQELMVMREMQEPKPAHILIRGNYDAPGEAVHPNTPPSILAFPASFPRNRYGLAQWLILPDNPLTTRVAVNRLWQNFFGTGLVKTAEDFGNQGEMPSHPELLDWLAVTFRNSGWDIKKLNKLIVMSATYRQASRAGNEAKEKDPEDRLLSHAPANRLSAEMLRDNALMAAGLLNTTIGGRSVKPYQPEGIWDINDAAYTRDSGAAVYRRSLYVIIKRSVPDPTLATFDAPSRSYCVMRRQKTNTPLQALVTLNDPTYVEAAAVMGQQMTRQTDLRQAITDAYRRLTGLIPTPDELTLLEDLQKTEEKKFQKNHAKAKGWLSAGQFRAAAGTNKARIAADAVVASTILNSDACLTKR
ncbi:MAG TPA: DUF1553 domain-containing protein [Puia sp.]|nr:DUF1553 domain-containing protein [Puia sp.]